MEQQQGGLDINEKGVAGGNTPPKYIACKDISCMSYITRYVFSEHPMRQRGP
jgi:hypothetical protein